MHTPVPRILVAVDRDAVPYAHVAAAPRRTSSSRTGPWPLRNRATGQVFGRVVHHPGTSPQPFIVESLQAIAGAVVRG